DGLYRERRSKSRGRSSNLFSCLKSRDAREGRNVVVSIPVRCSHQVRPHNSHLDKLTIENRAEEQSDQTLCMTFERGHQDKKR
ncbi:unnamed protein product, partial [Mycena citricolor]